MTGISAAFDALVAPEFRDAGRWDSWINFLAAEWVRFSIWAFGVKVNGSLSLSPTEQFHICRPEDLPTKRSSILF
jgi:hypothetical protein